MSPRALSVTMLATAALMQTATACGDDTTGGAGTLPSSSGSTAESSTASTSSGMSTSLPCGGCDAPTPFCDEAKRWDVIMVMRVARFEMARSFEGFVVVAALLLSGCAARGGDPPAAPPAADNHEAAAPAGPQPGVGWFVLPREEFAFAPATELPDGTCVAASDKVAERWLITPDLGAVPGIYGVHSPCDGRATPLARIEGVSSTRAVFHVKDRVVYWVWPAASAGDDEHRAHHHGSPNAPPSTQSSPPRPQPPRLYVTKGARGAPEALVPRIEFTEAAGAPDGLFVASRAGGLERWDGDWARLDPGPGEITSLFAEDGVVAVVLDEKTVKFSRDAGETWTDATSSLKQIRDLEAPLYAANAAPRPRTLQAKCSSLCDSGETTPAIDLGVPTTFPAAMFRVESPKGVRGLDGLLLDEELSLRAAAAKKCGGYYARMALAAGRAAVACADGIYTTEDAGRTFEKIGDHITFGTKAMAMSGDAIAVMNEKVCHGSGKPCDDASVEVFERTASGWSAERFSLADDDAAGVLLGGSDDTFLVVRVSGDRATLLRIADARLSRFHDVELVPDVRVPDDGTLGDAKVDDKGDLRLLVSGRDERVAYARISPLGELLSLEEVPGASFRAQRAFVADFGIVRVNAKNRSLAITRDGGATTSEVALPLAYPTAEELATADIECGSVGCDFVTREHRVLWRWGDHPFEASK